MLEIPLRTNQLPALRGSQPDEGRQTINHRRKCRFWGVEMSKEKNQTWVRRKREGWVRAAGPQSRAES